MNLSYSELESKIVDMLGEDEALRMGTEAMGFRLEHEKFRSYVPNGKCEQFINLVKAGKTLICLFSAANGVGKTAVGVNLLAHLIYSPQSAWFQGGVFDAWPFPKRARVVSDPTTVQRTLIPEIIKWFPLNQYFPNNGTKHYLSQWKIPSRDWEFDVMTYDQDVKEFESATLGYVWFDEPPPYHIFKATVARMRLGGIIVITATPLTGSAWMYDEILCKPQEGLRQFVHADVEDNCKIHGERGTLEHDHIKAMIANYTEDERQARMKGRFQHLTGLIFKKFDREIHVITPFRDWSHLAVIEALDPHPRNPDAVLWVGKDAKGRYYVLDEFYGKAKVEELAQVIHTKASRFRIVKRLADPSIFISDQHTEISLADRLEALGLEYEPGSKEREMAIRATEDKLNFEKKGVDFIKEPLLYVCSNCERTIWEMQHWQWDDWRGRSTERKDPKETPVDKDDHMLENLGRVLMEDVRQDDPVINRWQFKESVFDDIFGITPVVRHEDRAKVYR